MTERERGKNVLVFFTSMKNDEEQKALRQQINKQIQL